MRQIVFAHGTSAFMQAFVVVPSKIDTHKYQLFDEKNSERY